MDILVGNTIVPKTTSTKLLGVIIDEKQEWQQQIKTLTSSLNQRLFVIRRVQNQLPKEKLLCVVHNSLWMSKLRYGLQLYLKAVLNEDETRSPILKTLQLSQNRMLRGINKSRISDKIRTKSMLKKFDLLSVNQLAVQIKLIEVWKSINVTGHPIKLENYSQHSSDLTATLRPFNRTYNDSAKFKISQSSFHVDAARVCNLAPNSVTASKSIGELKKTSTSYVKTLPI
jgi:hypothetical protein